MYNYLLPVFQFIFDLAILNIHFTLWQVVGISVIFMGNAITVTYTIKTVREQMKQTRSNIDPVKVGNTEINQRDN